MIERVKTTGNYEGALYSASGTVAAATKICSGEITNAFVFTGYGDHHAGSTFFGGGCYFNGAALAISEVRRKFRFTRFAIIDTDAHHGDGTWELFDNDREVLYLCFCTGKSREHNKNVNIHVPPHTTDSDYLSLTKQAFHNRVAGFHPELIFWNWGYDSTTGEYGDMGLSQCYRTFGVSSVLKCLPNYKSSRMVGDWYVCGIIYQCFVYVARLAGKQLRRG
jgi:acetoin utilization deacetylase AcuC-like enzyme